MVASTALLSLGLLLEATLHPLQAAAGAGGDPQPSAAPPKQGAALLKVDLLGVFAHPDDETGVASTIVSYALGRGRTIAHAYITRGEGGGNMVGTHLGAALGMLREAEVRDCLGRLGVRYCYFLDQQDWAYTESLTATLRKWGKEETLGRVVRVIRTLRPEVIVTMNPTPNPGQHGHHQAAGVLAIEAFTSAADPARFPEQLRKEGLTAWQTRKIYFSGGGTNVPTIVTPIESLPDGRTPAQVAADALSHHRSQAFGSFSRAPWLSRPQSFTLVKSVLEIPNRETDLFEGLPLTSEPERSPRKSVNPLRPESLPRLAFVPRPAIQKYQRWIEEQEIGHLAGRFRADVPLVAGVPNTVTLTFAPVPGGAEHGRLRVIAPADWTVTPAEQAIRALTERLTHLEVQVTPPPGRPVDGELNATFGWKGRTVAAAAIGHPVPRAGVTRLRQAPLLNGSEAGWEDVTALRIAPGDVVQGRSTNEADSSAIFRLGHDGRRLYLDVVVEDDRIVSNIAPNDIKGHWRSDSVEICLDPAAGAEDTMGCYKLGIFPFDSTGVVRAARDADAQQGPVEETAPGTKLFSVRTPTGYRIQAAIPFSEIGVKAKRGLRLGFNLIIYDGDKPDAAPGENINKSRLAWSPRPGVQGRPEDWGRVELE